MESESRRTCALARLTSRGIPPLRLLKVELGSPWNQFGGRH